MFEHRGILVWLGKLGHEERLKKATCYSSTIVFAYKMNTPNIFRNCNLSLIGKIL